MLHLLWDLTFFSQEVPLLHAPVEVDGVTAGVTTGVTSGVTSGVTAGARNVSGFGGKGYLERLVELGGAAGAGNTSHMTAEEMHLYNQYNQSGGQVEMDYTGAGMMTGQEHAFSQYRAGMFDGMALSEQFLGEYYSSVST